MKLKKITYKLFLILFNKHIFNFYKKIINLNTSFVYYKINYLLSYVLIFIK